MQRSIASRAWRRVGLIIFGCLLLAGVCAFIEQRVQASQAPAAFGDFPPGFVSEIVAGSGQRYVKDLRLSGGQNRIINWTSFIKTSLPTLALTKKPTVWARLHFCV